MKKCIVLTILCSSLTLSSTDWREAGFTAVGVYSCKKALDIASRDRTSSESRDVFIALISAVAGTLLIYNAKKIAGAFD